MATLQDIIQRAEALKEETALNSISPDRAGGIMYDTLIYINQMQLQESNPLLISKIYASVAAMEADSSPVSDLTGRALVPGQVVCIVTSDTTSSDYGVIYRYNGTTGGASSWSATGKIGSLPYMIGYQFMGVATPSTNPGTPDQKVFYIAGPGNYPNFDLLSIPNGYIGVLKYASSWSVEIMSLAGSTIYHLPSTPNYMLLSASTGNPVVLAGDDYDTTDFIDIYGFDYIEYVETFPLSSYAGICLYDSGKSKIAAFGGSGIVDLSDYPTARYMRFCGSRNYNVEAIVGNELVDGHVVTSYASTIERIAEFCNTIGRGVKITIPNVNYKLLKNATGEEALLAGDDYDVSDYVNIKGADRIVIFQTFPAVGSYCGLCFYSQNKTYLHSYSGGTNDISVPANAVFVKIAGARGKKPFAVAYNSNTLSNIVATNVVDIRETMDRVSVIESKVDIYNNTTIRVGATQTYTTIQDALTSITDNTRDNRYTILVDEGTYDISDAGINFIPIKPWVKIQGVSRKAKVVFTSTNYNAYKNIFQNISGFNGFAEICNLSFETQKVKGTLHLDGTDWQGEIYMHDCDIYTLENENPYDPTADYFMTQAASYGSINTATHRNQTIRVENIITNGYIYSHTELGGVTDIESESARFIVKGCVCDWIGVYDNGSKTRKQAIIEDNKCNFIKIACNNANNLDFMQWDVTLKNNNCKFVQGLYTPYNSQSVVNLWDNFYNNRMVFADSNLHRMVKNSTGAAIGRGTKVVFTDATQHEIAIATGDTYDAITCQTINYDDYGIVQNGGDLAYYWNYIQAHPFEQS